MGYVTPTNRGKKFEQQIKKSFEKISDLSIDRFYDTTNGFAGIHNVSDFVVYKYPIQLYVECKSTHNDKFYWDKLSQGQYEGMKEKFKIRGVYAGVILWFIQHDITVYIPIDYITKLKLNGIKGISYEDVVNTDEVYIIPQKKHRVYCDYDFTELLDILSEENNYEDND